MFIAKFLIKHKPNILLIICLLLVGLLLFNKLLVYGFFLLSISVGFYILWNSYIKGLFSELKISKDNNMALNSENENLKRAKVNIVGIEEILELNLYEVETNFVRTWNTKLSKDSKQLSFLGALNVNLIVKYGVDVKRSIKIDEVNSIVYILNDLQTSQSFKDITYTWDIADVLIFHNPKFNKFGTSYWFTNNDTLVYTNELKCTFQNEVHTQVLQGPKELSWLKKSVQEKVKVTLLNFFKTSNNRIEFVDDFDNLNIAEDSKRKLSISKLALN